ncbi:serine hydrolase [Sphingomonas crocodyli]|uniref:beta-lactamase n=1 Tax=Sphingomonas crocodyli TaxID=1979270 RepID=A0A437LYL1_9SPHN|nr:serine hydrolase [Sphingomonas crocodyli]RVT90500.1 serine hydrolase [Sphingomonas crocodyli]
MLNAVGFPIRLASGALLLAPLLLLAACQPAAPDPQAPRTTPQLASPKPVRAPSTQAPKPKSVAIAPPAIPSAAAALDRRIEALGAAFRGDVGLAVRDIQTGWTSHYRGLDYFPQQSVSKLWVAISAFDMADRGKIDLHGKLSIRADDLTLFHQPIKSLATRPGGFQTDREDLLTRALTQSDNSANDKMLREVGGPDAVRATLAAKSISGIRFGPGEKGLQSRIAGLDWQPAFSKGDGFYAAREAVPIARRRAAFEAYVADPIDGARPLAMVDALARLKNGQLLSDASTAQMLDIMGQTRTGALRLKSGLRPGWTLSHKTGTGQILQGEQAGYNDVGILTSPEGRSYAIAVMIGRTSRPLPERMDLMRKVVRTTITYDSELGNQRQAGPT